MTLIAFSTATLAFEDPLMDPESDKAKILKTIDVVMTIIFSIEALMKIIAMGFIFNGENSYLADGWNILDFFIVLSSVFSLLPGVSTSISFVKAFRFARILRPLRSIKRMKGLKLSVTSLFKSIPGIAKLFLVVLFFILLIAILMTTLYSGTFFRCQFPEETSLTWEQQQIFIVDKWDCLNYGGEWVKPDMNYD